MTGLSDRYEQNVLNALLRGIALQVPTIYIGLNTADPQDGAVANEVLDTSYARKVGAFTNPTLGAGTSSNSADITYSALAGSPSPSVTVTHVTFWDAASAGFLVMSQALNTAKTFAVGDVPRFPIGSLTVTAS